jgi:hypothetical protein
MSGKVTCPQAVSREVRTRNKNKQTNKPSTRLIDNVSVDTFARVSTI